MDKDNETTRKLHEEFKSFNNTMEELHLLKSIAEDLKNYRKMIRLKKYDWQTLVNGTAAIFVQMNFPFASISKSKEYGLVQLPLIQLEDRLLRMEETGTCRQALIFFYPHDN